MSEEIENPFRITKSNNLTDEQIDSLWVTPDSHQETSSYFRPTSSMAMFILGGKGSGKSHLMRYYGFSLQALRFRKSKVSILDGVSVDRYVGLYSLCKGMDAHRFRGKGQPQDKWDDLFAYYFELWVADKLLTFLGLLVDEESIGPSADSELAVAIVRLFDKPLKIGDVVNVNSVREHLAKLRREADFAINNVSMCGKLEVEILASRGSILFGVPRLAVSMIPKFKEVMFVYLLDEFENFDETQQTYINTLIREKEGPTSFKIGARLYGFRTRNTLSGGEKNREGSEYEVLRLDDRYRKDQQIYKEFALKLIGRRLEVSSYLTPSSAANEPVLSDMFETEEFSERSEFLRSFFENGKDRPHLTNFRKKLGRGVREKLLIGVQSEDELEKIVEAVSFKDHPLLEKLCILYVYQQWFRGADVAKVVEEVRESGLCYLKGQRGDKFSEFFNKYKGDMVAQLLRENGKPQIYAGMDAFVRMSEGLPRALITLLKHTFDWAAYTQERPFQQEPFSLRAQQRGAADAANWFLDEMLMEGHDGVLVQSAIHRLAQLFRVNRFAEKPIETSMIAFSVDEIRLSAEARRVLRLAVNTSLLVEVPRGQRERNSEQVTSKLELNTMLAPRYDLPIARRGVVPLTPSDVDAIFTYEASEQFDLLLKTWEAKMSAPAFGRGRVVDGGNPRDDQPGLFE